MNDCSRTAAGLRLGTNCFTLKECKILSDLLQSKYNIINSIELGVPTYKWFIYIPKGASKELHKAIKDHLIPSMKYKFYVT